MTPPSSADPNRSASFGNPLVSSMTTTIVEDRSAVSPTAAMATAANDSVSICTTTTSTVDSTIRRSTYVAPLHRRHHCTNISKCSSRCHRLFRERRLRQNRPLSHTLSAMERQTNRTTTTTEERTAASRCTTTISSTSRSTATEQPQRPVSADIRRRRSFSANVVQFTR